MPQVRTRPGSSPRSVLSRGRSARGGGKYSGRSGSSEPGSGSGSALSPERGRVDAQLMIAERALAPFLGPNVEGSLDLSGVTESSGWEGVKDRLRALLGSAASMATDTRAAAKRAAKAAASALASAAGSAAGAVRAQMASATAGARDALQALWEQFKSMQKSALSIAGGLTLALALAAAYLLFSRYGGRAA